MNKVKTPSVCCRSNLGGARRVLQNLCFSSCRDPLPTLPVCVCIQFPLAPFHLPAFRKRHIYLYNFSNRRYDVAYVVWENLFRLSESEGRGRNFIMNSLLCPL
jgi:hypothetical protein